jgi:hypothetical protein
MIERYTIEFGPAVSQKEHEKALHEFGETPAQIPDLTRVKARIEIVGDFADLKRIAEILKRTDRGRTGDSHQLHSSIESCPATDLL